MAAVSCGIRCINVRYILLIHPTNTNVMHKGKNNVKVKVT